MLDRPALRLRPLLFLVALHGFQGDASAQGCNFGDDGFAAVSCAAPVQPSLPQFPSLASGGRFACLKDCGVENQFRVRVQVGHVPLVADLAVLPVTITPGSPSAPGYGGILLGKYVRTWREVDASGVLARQVWRFLVNGDLAPTAGAAPCPLPPHPPGVSTHFHGHVDYACDVDPAGNLVFRLAMSLHHLQGCIEHGLLSCVPSFGPPAHSDRSYHLVAPANFVFQATAPSVLRQTVAESVRSTSFQPAYQALGEAPVALGQVGPLLQDCLCVQPAANPTHRYTHYRMSGTIACGGASTSFASLPIGVPVAPLPIGVPVAPLPAGATELPLGSWTGSPGGFPGTRSLSTHWGLLSYADPANPNDPPFHFVQGVSTYGELGVLFSQPGATFSTFLDLTDMRNPASLASGPIFPAWGCLYVSKLVFSLNVR